MSDPFIVDYTLSPPRKQDTNFLIIRFQELADPCQTL